MGPKERGSLRELAALRLKLRTVAFGGPAARIAMMEEEVVRRMLGPRIRRSPTAGAFLDGVTVASLVLMGTVAI